MLIKGREESPDGRLILYSRGPSKFCIFNNEVKTTNGIIAYYVSNDKTALFNKFPDTENLLHNAVKGFTEELVRVTGFDVPREYIKRYLEGDELLSLGHRFRLKSEDFSYVSEDVSFAGSHNTTKECYSAMGNDLLYYLKKLEKQKRFPVNFEDFRGQPIDNFIKERYVNKMIAAKRNNDDYIFNKVKKDFNKFSKNSNFKKQTKDLSNIIANLFCSEKKEYELINDYISLIDALHRHDEKSWLVVLLDRKIKGELF